MALGFASSSLLQSQKAMSPKDISDYYQAWDCKGWDNSKLVTNIVWSFWVPPQVGVQDWLRTYITPNKDTYISTITLSVKLGGVLIYKFNEPVDRLFPANEETSKGMWIPTEQQALEI